nr:trace amine-associated receptor 6-like [Salvelinus alpinus]
MLHYSSSYQTAGTGNGTSAGLGYTEERGHHMVERDSADIHCPDSVSNSVSNSVFLEDYVVSTGDTLDLSCNPDGPAQAVLWFKDGSGLLPSNRTRVDQRVLRIINVSYEDSGMYSCHVTHDNNLLSNYTIRVTDSENLKPSILDVQFCFQDRNSSCRKASLSTAIYITLYIFFSLISAVTVFLNLLVIISISHFKQLHTPTNLLILSLAVSDLLVGLIVIPATTVAIMESCWGFGEYFCLFEFYIAYLCTSLSLGNLVLISIDRYVAVCDPLLYHSKITITRIMCCISISWKRNAGKRS